MTYLTIGRDTSYEIEIKRSRFVCSLVRVGDEDAARAAIGRTRKRHWDARHHCTAYVVGYPQPTQRSSDDGEPAGTAGTPMLEVLRRNGLTDTLAVVSRYFGGVLLGAGGLARAYGSAVAGAVDAAGTTVRVPVSLLAVDADHAYAGALEHGLRATGRSVRDVAYRSDGVHFEIGLPPGEVEPFLAWLAQTTGGAATATETGRTYADRPLS